MVEKMVGNQVGDGPVTPGEIMFALLSNGAVWVSKSVPGSRRSIGYIKSGRFYASEVGLTVDDLKEIVLYLEQN